MTKKVLIAYATRSGSIEKIAEKIAQRIIGQGHSAELKNLKTTPSNYLHEYDGIIVGTGTKGVGWASEIDLFLKENKGDIMTKKFGFFICNTNSRSNNNGSAIVTDSFYSTQLQQVGITPHLCDTIRSTYEPLSKKPKKGILGKLLLGGADKETMRDYELVLAADELNDFINWRDVERFSSEYIKILNEK